MSEMEERVAAAIRVALAESDAGRAAIDSDYQNAASAAIEAMRFPTTEMVNEGYTAPTHGDGCSDIPSVWGLMIDAALAS